MKLKTHTLRKIENSLKMANNLTLSVKIIFQNCCQFEFVALKLHWEKYLIFLREIFTSAIKSLLNRTLTMISYQVFTESNKKLFQIPPQLLTLQNKDCDEHFSNAWIKFLSFFRYTPPLIKSTSEINSICSIAWN